MKVLLQKGPRQPAVEIEVKSGTTIEEMYLSMRDELPYKVLAAKVDNKVEELCSVFKIYKEIISHHIDKA